MKMVAFFFNLCLCLCYLVLLQKILQIDQVQKKKRKRNNWKLIGYYMSNTQLIHGEDPIRNPTFYLSYKHILLCFQQQL